MDDSQELTFDNHSENRQCNNKSVRTNACTITPLETLLIQTRSSNNSYRFTVSLDTHRTFLFARFYETLDSSVRSA